MNHNHNLLMLKTTPQPPQTLCPPCPPCDPGSPDEASTHSPSPESETEFALELRQVAIESEELNAAIGGPTCDLLANWLAPRYLLAVRKQLAKLSKDSDRLKLMNRALVIAVALQRGGYWTPHLKLGEKRLELANEKHRHAVAIAQPSPQKLRDPKAPLSDEDRQAIVDKVDEIFGLK